MPDVHPRRHDDARLVEASRAGDPAAFPALFEHWFDPCVDVAWRIVHDRDAAADVAQETFLAAWRGLDDLREPGAFGGWVLRTARNRALDRLARDRRSVATGEDQVSAALDAQAGAAGAAGPAGAGGPGDEPGAAVERDENASLVWAASAALGERDASVLDLHLRHGLAVPEIAEALGVTPNNAHQLLFRLRKRLSGAIRAWVLWRDGDPACAELGAALEAAGVTRFGAEAVRVASRHVPECEDCDARQQLRLAPEALFAAIPVVPAGSVLRARAVAALREEGVPVPPTPDPASPDGDTTPDGGDPPDPGSGPHPNSGSPADGPDGGDPSGVADARTGAASGRTRRGLIGAGLAAAVVVGAVALLAGRSGGEETIDASGSSRRDEPTSTRPTDPPPTMAATTTTGGPGPTATTSTGSTGSTGGTGTSTAPDPVDEPPLPPGGDPGTDEPPPPPPATPEPVIVRLAATEGQPGPPCGSVERRVTVVWATEEATAATLAGPGAPTGEQPPNGQATACVPRGQPQPATFTLTATGPGGTTESTATA